MSEFQYYEFQKMTGPLSPKEMTEIRKLSSRVQIAGNQAKFVYNYGDFKGDPEKLLASYFDSMLYIANWGSKKLSFRLPYSDISPEEISIYECEDAVSFQEFDDSLIVSMCYNCEEGLGWIYDEEIALTLSNLQGLRKALLAKDYRCLYLAWLTIYEIDDPVLKDLPFPANMEKLSEELLFFVDFFSIDRKILQNISARLMESAQ